MFYKLKKSTIPFLKLIKVKGTEERKETSDENERKNFLLKK